MGLGPLGGHRKNVDPESFERYKKLRAEYLAHPGKVFLDNRRRLDDTLHILHGNYAHLRLLLKQLEDPAKEIELMAEANREGLYAYLREVIRLLHNYLASVLTWVHHCRNAMRDQYEDHPFLEAYQAKVTADFATSGLHHFMQELRNEMLHHELITAPITSKWTPTSFDTHVQLRRERLQGIDWNAEARSFVDSLTDDLNLEEVLDRYHRKVLEFHVWTVQEQVKIHKGEIAASRVLLDEIGRLEGFDIATGERRE